MSLNVKGYNGRSHRTLLVIDLTGADGNAIERAERLVESVNGVNIKCDVITVKDGVAVSGFAPELGGSSFDDSFASAKEFAKDNNYTQVLISQPAKS